MFSKKNNAILHLYVNDEPVTSQESTSAMQKNTTPLLTTQNTDLVSEVDDATKSENNEKTDQPWQEENSRKKKRNSPEGLRNVRQKTIMDYLQKTNVHNRFQTLSADEEETTTETELNREKETKPPPIFIPDVLQIKPLIEILNKVAKDGYSFKILAKNQVKVQPATSINYYSITKELKVKETAFHTYQLKEDRNFRVVIKNIHPTTDIEELSAQIAEKGHEVMNIYNIKHRINKQPLPMFFVDIKPKENNKKIYEIQFLQYTKVQIEPPRQKREIVQCLRCQRYGHTKGYCTRQPRCVKCGNNHSTAQCTKTNDTAATCVLCNGKHPANYKGCTVYKELQQRKFPPLRPKQIESTSAAKPSSSSCTQHVRPGISYAQIAKEKNHQIQQTNNLQPNTVIPSTNNNILEQMLSKLMERMDTMLNILMTLISKMP